jgi:hypothetical protein
MMRKPPEPDAGRQETGEPQGRRRAGAGGSADGNPSGGADDFGGTLAPSLSLSVGLFFSFSCKNGSLSPCSW